MQNVQNMKLIELNIEIHLLISIKIYYVKNEKEISTLFLVCVYKRTFFFDEEKYSLGNFYLRPSN